MFPAKVIANFNISHSLKPVNSTLVKSENSVFSLKTHQMFSVYVKPEEFQNATITG